MTWNWATHLAEHHEVCLITHSKYRKDIEEYQAKHPNPNLRFDWCMAPSIIDPWDYTIEHNERWIKTHYMIWQRWALKRALQIYKQEKFDLVHHVSWGTVGAPPGLWKLPIPFVWGPIGGGMTSPPAFRAYFGKADKLEYLRQLRLAALPHFPAMKRAAKRSAVILATNQETINVLTEAGAKNVRPFLDTGLPSDTIPEVMPPRPNNDVFTMIWAGRLWPRKALTLGLDALAIVKKKIDVRLLVAGEGESREEWEEHGRKIGVDDCVKYLGWVPHAQMNELYRSSDAFLFTSLRDSFGGVTLEAMGQALPVVALDHQGVAAMIPDDAALKVPVTNPAETVEKLAEAMLQLAKSPSLRESMRERAWRFAQQNTWHARAEEMSRLYEQCLNGFPSNGSQAAA